MKHEQKCKISLTKEWSMWEVDVININDRSRSSNTLIKSFKAFRRSIQQPRESPQGNKKHHSLNRIIN